MKPRTQRRTPRWSERSPATDLVSPYADVPPSPREPRNIDSSVRQGPYESSYDISLGYGHDRSIVLP